MDPFVGEIRIFAGSFAPNGWALCNGQLIPINQNQALFSLLGTQYGGNGQTTFALPDLRGRAPMHFGQGLGLQDYAQGMVVGTEAVTLTPNQMPAHSHGLPAAGSQSSDRPDGAAPAPGGSYGSPSGSMAPTAPTGGNQPHNNMQPSLVVNFIIALQGVYPSRS